MKFGLASVKVGLDFGHRIQPVGRLAIKDQIIYFEYDSEFIKKGMEISPLKLPLQTGVIQLPIRPFEGLAGVFADSLPDGWGRLLFDRKFRSMGILPTQVSSLDRLSYVGFGGMGALVYEPDHSVNEGKNVLDLDLLAAQTQEVLKGYSEEVLNELLALNGSSAGARPKALIRVDKTKTFISHGIGTSESGFESWLVKFPNSQDGVDAGAIEYCYSLMAKEAGVEVPDTHLFPSQRGPGFFAAKRFDREGSSRLHMHTAAGLVHTDFRVPSMDYEDLLSLTGLLTKDVRELEKMYRLAVFNVLAYNRDDHAKNFSFLMDELGNWKLAPGYDLNFASGPAGEQSTMVMGEGKNPGINHLIQLGKEAYLPKNKISDIIDQTRTSLLKWEGLAAEFGVRPSTITMISKLIAGR